MRVSRGIRSISAIALLSLALAVTAAHGEFDPEAWRVARDIKAPEGAAGGMARAALDNHVWKNAADPSLNDLRVIRGKVEEIGYALYVPAEAPPRIEERRVRVFNAAVSPKVSSEISLDLGDAPPITNRIRLGTSARNFRCAVTIEGCDDGKDWKTIRSDAAIFDFTGDESARFTTVGFPDTRYRYLRAVVAAPSGGKPIALTGAMVFQEIPADKPELEMLLVRRPIRHTEIQLRRETHFILDLGVRNLPVSRILLQTPGKNFFRRTLISVSNDNKRWSEAGSGCVFRFRTDRYRQEELAVEFGERFGRYLRVRVLNEDNPPLVVTRITVHSRPRYIFFPFTPGRRYRLVYGNQRARRPQYEFPKVFARMDRRSAIEARLGRPERNVRFIPTRDAVLPDPWIQRNQWILYAALVVAVVGLGIVAIRALKQGKESQKQ